MQASDRDCGLVRHTIWEAAHLLLALVARAEASVPRDAMEVVTLYMVEGKL